MTTSCARDRFSSSFFISSTKGVMSGCSVQLGMLSRVEKRRVHRSCCQYLHRDIGLFVSAVLINRSAVDTQFLPAVAAENLPILLLRIVLVHYSAEPYAWKLTTPRATDMALCWFETLLDALSFTTRVFHQFHHKHHCFHCISMPCIR